MLDSEYMVAKMLGMNGFSAQCVVDQLAQRGRIISRSTVYSIWSKEGVKVREYRNGKTQEAKRVIVHLVPPRIKRLKRA